ncbi:hypothetical protein GGR58DRAFT_452693 [Xylaria digitata]|nr:hypothetical protein GGR58DRAFT_452693 [Xylaria digitata]
MPTIALDTTRAVLIGSIEVLSQEISDEEGMYRIRSRQHVYYLTISTDVFDEDTMCRPYLLLPQLPSLSDMPWFQSRASTQCRRT